MSIISKKTFWAPTAMFPNQEVYENLGFSFGMLDSDGLMCLASLPQGWYLEKLFVDSKSTDIKDAEENLRGRFHIEYGNSIRLDMNLFCRYGAIINQIDVWGKQQEIFFGNPSEKLFIAGEIHFNGEEGSSEWCNSQREMHHLFLIAEQFGDEHYPDWRNVTAYWDTNKNLKDDNSQKKALQK